jgi:hypothetical protein
MYQDDPARSHRNTTRSHRGTSGFGVTFMTTTVVRRGQHRNYR